MQPSTIACRAGSHYSGYRSLGFSLSTGDFSSGNASGFGRRLRAARSTEDAADWPLSTVGKHSRSRCVLSWMSASEFGLQSASTLDRQYSEL